MDPMLLVEVRKRQLMAKQMGQTNSRDVDWETGGDWQARLNVAMADSPEAKLSIAKTFYPDAKIVPIGGEGVVNGIQQSVPYDQHIVFTHPKTGKPTVLNPPGFDFKDVTELAKPVARGVAALAAAKGGAIRSNVGPLIADQAVDVGLEQGAKLVTGANDPRPGKEQVMEQVGEAAQAAPGMAFGTAAGLYAQRAGQQVKQALRKGTFKPMGHERPDVLEALQRQDVPIEGAAPLISESNEVAGYFDVAKGKPNTARTMQGATSSTYGGVEKAGRRVVEPVGRMTEKASAGEQALEGFSRYEVRTEEVADRLYARSKGLKELPIDIRAVKERARGIKASITEGPGETPGWVDKLLEMPDEIPFNRAKTWRSDLLRIQRNTSETVAGQSRGAAERLSGDFDQAMEASAGQLEPGDFAKWRKANEFYKGRAEALKEVSKIANSDTGEVAFKKIFEGAADGPSKLRAVKRQIPADAWEDLVGVKLREMSIGGDGEFSPAQFLKNWDSIKSQEAKNLLFPPATQLRKNLDDLALISRRMRETKYSERVTGSPTQPRMEYGAALEKGLLGKSLLGVGKDVVTLKWNKLSAQSQAKLMTNPDFVKWLANGQRVNPADTKSVGAHVGRLTSIASNTPEIRGEIRSLIGIDEERE